MLKDNNLIVDVRRMRLSRYYADGSSVEYYVGNSTSPCRVVYRNISCSAAESVILPAGETTIMPITLHYPLMLKDCFLFCPVNVDEILYFEEGTNLSNLQAYPGIFTPDNSSPAILVAAGEASQDMTVGDIIGTVSSVIFANRINHNKDVGVAAFPSKPDEGTCDDVLDLESSIAQSTRLTDEQRK